jgi:CRP/FNR family transcriptional regulator
MTTTIDTDILVAWGAQSKKYAKGEVIFNEGDDPRFYYQILKGQVKIYNLSQDGREFTHGIFCNGESFGEPPLFIDEKYPTTAVSTAESVIFRLPKERFLQILDEERDIEKMFLKLMATRIYNKTTAASFIVNHTPKERIMSFLKEFKRHNINNSARVVIPYTRQDIANLTGLRVETVIRTVIDLKKKGVVDIVNRKIYF